MHYVTDCSMTELRNVTAHSLCYSHGAPVVARLLCDTFKRSLKVFKSAIHYCSVMCDENSHISPVITKYRF